MSKSERFWSGGIDRNQTENVEVFVDGEIIIIGVQERSNRTAFLPISQKEAKHIIGMLESAIKHSNEWVGDLKK